MMVNQSQDLLVEVANGGDLTVRQVRLRRLDIEDQLHAMTKLTDAKNRARMNLKCIQTP